MRRTLSVFSPTLAASALTALMLGLSVQTASAVDYSHEDHCFANGASRATLYVEDEYANGTLEDEDKAEAVEQLTMRHWQLRLSALPFTVDQDLFRGSFDSDTARPRSPYGWYDAKTAIWLDEAEEYRNRRSGSRFIYVNPEMKMLARERGLVRNAKRKPCNPHILYLG